jgi:hypothetical protein
MELSYFWGYPQFSSIYRWMFPKKPSSYWGSPMTMETPSHQTTKVRPICFAAENLPISFSVIIDVRKPL